MVFISWRTYWRRRWGVLLLALAVSVLLGLLGAYRQNDWTAAVALPVSLGLAVSADNLHVAAERRVPTFNTFRSRVRQGAVLLLFGCIPLVTLGVLLPPAGLMIWFGLVILASTALEIGYLERRIRAKAIR